MIRQARNGWNTLTEDMRVEASVFVMVLEYESTDSLQFRFATNAGPSIDINAGTPRNAWTHHVRSRRGIGGCVQTTLTGGLGRIKLALVLPYMGFGDHGGRAVWAPFLGYANARETWFQDDVDLGLFSKTDHTNHGRRLVEKKEVTKDQDDGEEGHAQLWQEIRELRAEITALKNAAKVAGQ